MLQYTINNIEKLDYRADEAYKRLRSNVQISGEDVQVIEITSCIPNDGKTEVSFNLAMSFAQLGKKVLFIDADIRHSVMVKDFRIQGVTKGLTHFLSGMATLEDVVGKTNVEHLDMILAGTIAPNPTELLGGTRFESLIQAAREAYDYIIIDTPPLASVVDAQIIAGLADGVALIVAAKEVSYKIAQNIIRDLRFTGVKILGVVLNKVNLEEKGAYGKYYGAYYGKYYGRYYGKYYGDYYGEKKKK